MCRCYLHLLVLPPVLRVYKLEPEVSAVGNSVNVVFVTSSLKTSSIVFQISYGYVGDDPRMVGGVRLSLLVDIIQTPSSPV